MNQHKYALAIKSCHKYAERRQAQLDTCLKQVDADFFFVVGDPAPKGKDFLYIRGASDEFQDIAPKVLGAVQYALDSSVTNLVISDDDTYFCWSRLMKSGFYKFDYLGFVRSYNPIPYQQGSFFCLSERAMERIMKNKRHMRNGIPDDVAVGNCLYGEVPFTHEHRFSVGAPYPAPRMWPAKVNDIIAAH